MPGYPSSASAEPPGHPARGLARMHRYWLAVTLALAGTVVTAVSGWQTARWAQARDAERFAVECRLAVGMIQQKMERYESALDRMRDVCARNHGEISEPDWNGWLIHTLGIGVNYANIRSLVVAPKVSAADRAAFGQRAAAQVAKHPGTIVTSREEAGEWFPVWRRWAKSDLAQPGLGDDLLAETRQHPSFQVVLGDTLGWVSAQPSRLQTTNGSEAVGFWFVVAIRPLEFTNSIRWQRPSETLAQAAKRQRHQRSQLTTGLLAAFFDGDLFLNEFNGETNLLRVQLFTSKEPAAEVLLNPGHAPPAQALFIHDHVMAWYGRRWTARFHSMPLFEAGSIRYRTWLVWGFGSFLSLGAGAAVAWQTRSRWREAALAEQLREALSRQERISRDLHDGTLQSIYGLGLGLQRAQRLLAKQPEAAANQLAGTTAALQRTVEELRVVIRETDPTAREDVPLGEALAGVVSHLRLATETELQLEIAPGADQGLTAAQSLQLLNIAREALSNCVRHSGARQVRIALARSAGLLRLEVADDGCGFDPALGQREGRGLRNLAARVRELSGIHRWESPAGRGSQLVVEVPLVAASRPAGPKGTHA